MSDCHSEPPADISTKDQTEAEEQPSELIVEELPQETAASSTIPTMLSTDSLNNSDLSPDPDLDLEEHAIISTAEKVSDAPIDNIIVIIDQDQPDTLEASDTTNTAETVQSSDASAPQDTSPHESVLTIQVATPVAVIVYNEDALPLHPPQRLHKQMQRYVRRSLRERWRTSFLSKLSVIFLAILLLGIISPLALAISYGIRTYATYESLRSHASSGIQHVLNVSTIFSTSASQSGQAGNSSRILDTTKLLRARQELSAARSDFTQVQSQIDHTALLQIVAQYLPQYRSQIVSARAATQIGIDVTDIGQQLINVGLQLAPRLHGPLLSNASTPLITEQDFTMIQATLDRILPFANDILLQSHSLSLDALPLNDHQRALARQYLPLLPQAVQALNTARGMMGSIGWLLGVDAPRTFLVETMDRAELRPTGGFTGQYGELHISGGRLAPFSLTNVALVEYADNTPVAGNLAPAAYTSWWPFANWGLRDANLSADFPTSARLVANQYELELKHPVDGVIMFTPFLIEHILRVTGPLPIPKYNETITVANLEERLHYYQLDNAGIRKEELVEHVEDPEQARKLFTSELAHTLMDRVRQASTSELLGLGSQMLEAMKTRDLQVYFTNPQLENLLMQYDYAGQMDRSMTHDGLYIVQANVSASKASQYVQTLVHDTVTLDDTGGATHVMQMRLIYNQTGPVYGLDTYRDYVRVYVPPTAQFLSGDGFDTGQPLCGGPFAACPADGIYPNNELVCPPGQYFAGPAAPMLNDPYAGQNHPLDKIGPPTNLKSDEPGRTMFGGYIVIPKNCTMTVTLSWYVPPMHQSTYTLLYQRQAATFPQLDLTIQPPSIACATDTISPLHFTGVLTQDMSFSLNNALQGSHADCPPLSTS